MSAIKTVRTAVPTHCYNLADIAHAGTAWLAGDEANHERFQRFLQASQTGTRNFVVPIEQILSFNGLKHRSEIFEIEAPALGAQALQSAFHAANVTPQEIESLLFTSCSCPSIPSVDAVILDAVGMNRTVRRVPMYQQGCAGGVVGLSLAAELAGQGRMVSLVSVELCSLVFQPGNHSGGHLVGSAIFGDGAAAALIGPEDKGFVIHATQSFLLEETRHLMGYDIEDNGFHLRLDRELPSYLSRRVPEIVREFLAGQKLNIEEVAWWLFHPGGVKILSFLEEVFALRPEQCHWSRDVLMNVGNLSSASILFVLEKFIDSSVYRSGDFALVMGIGPGLTVELILLQYL